MTNSKKPEHQATKASATELDEADLEAIDGGPAYLKLGDIDGESRVVAKSAQQLKLDRGGVSNKPDSENLSLNFEKIKF